MEHVDFKQLALCYQHPYEPKLGFRTTDNLAPTGCYFLNVKTSERECEINFESCQVNFSENSKNATNVFISLKVKRKEKDIQAIKGQSLTFTCRPSFSFNKFCSHKSQQLGAIFQSS